MQQYLDLLKRIYTEGTRRLDRTGTGTISLFGAQMRFDLKDNQFPLLTTKKIFIRGLIEELLWFKRGSTNNQELEALDVHIWDGWALKEDVTREVEIHGYVRVTLLAEKLGITHAEALAKVTEADNVERDTNGNPSPAGGKKLLDEHEIPQYRTEVAIARGELGPIYGKQWRSWPCPDGRVIDQIAEVIHLLKTKPHSRRLVVTAWNPADLPDESISPQENVLQGRQSLASCHCLFQFDSRPLTIDERFAWLKKNQHIDVKDASFFGLDLNDPIMVNAYLETREVPVYGLSCQLYQRSADFFLGVPFNIASYALLTAMIAQVCNMVPDEFIWTGGNVHIYSNHFEQVEEQLSREPLPGPTLHLHPGITNFDDFEFKHFRIDNYKSHATIKAPVSV